MTNDEILARLHEISLELLEKADAVMNEIDAGYMLDAGTLLGAVRHHGLIPWDDDADICMLRDEYDKFLKIGKKYFDEDFELIIPAEKGDEAFYDFVPKIIYKKAVVDKDSEDAVFYGRRYSHPALDIFVIDDVPNTKAGQKLHTGLLILIYGLAMGHRRKIDYDKYSAGQKIVIGVLSKIGKLVPLYKTAKLYDGAAKMFDKKGKTKVMSTHSAMDAFGDVYEKEWYEKSVKSEFEGKEFPLPSGFEGILKKHYGDFMK
ncbi:MAG: LicD family protein, partial [Clostridia bacterium]|nr:LicD family protein [Clostridia bacterium]